MKKLIVLVFLTICFFANSQTMDVYSDYAKDYLTFFLHNLCYCNSKSKNDKILNLEQLCDYLLLEENSISSDSIEYISTYVLDSIRWDSIDIMIINMLRRCNISSVESYMDTASILIDGRHVRSNGDVVDEYGNIMYDDEGDEMRVLPTVGIKIELVQLVERINNIPTLSKSIVYNKPLIKEISTMLHLDCYQDILNNKEPHVHKYKNTYYGRKRSGVSEIVFCHGRVWIPYSVLWPWKFFDGKNKPEPNEKYQLVPFQENKLYGYMSLTGDTIIEPKYEEANFFENGKALVRANGNYFLIPHPFLDDKDIIGVTNVIPFVVSDIDRNIPNNSKNSENTFTVIIANQNYNNFVCPYAINDGKIFKEYCFKTLGIPERNIFYYEDATLNNIHSAMSRIKDLADVYEGDAKIIFYYVGQGITDNNKQAYIMPSDASINLINSTGYSLKSLYNELGDLTVKSAVVFLDAGFNNEDRTGKNIGNNRGVAIKNKEEQMKGKVISISATSPGETALLYKDKSHGLFTYYICKKLQETKGDVNIEDLYIYIRDNVSKTSLKRQLPKIEYNNIEIKKEHL